MLAYEVIVQSHKNCGKVLKGDSYDRRGGDRKLKLGRVFSFCDINPPLDLPFREGTHSNLKKKLKAQCLIRDVIILIHCIFPKKTLKSVGTQQELNKCWQNQLTFVECLVCTMYFTWMKELRKRKVKS